MSLDTSLLPQHVAIIMDGNRRWAKAKGFNVLEGHRRVVDDVIEPLVDRCIELGIPYLTLWAFSTENWERDKNELQGIMQLFRYGLKKKSDDLAKKGVRIKVLGGLERFPKDIAEACRSFIEKTKNNDKITVTFALNYGGRDELSRAFQRLMDEKKELLERGTLSVHDLDVNEKAIADHLDNPDIPDPDLIIRPGGQMRLSGFMPWQAVYAELFFSPILMPDFNVPEFEQALEDYQQRQRRFGR